MVKRQRFGWSIANEEDECSTGVATLVNHSTAAGEGKRQGVV